MAKRLFGSHKRKNECLHFYQEWAFQGKHEYTETDKQISEWWDRVKHMNVRKNFQTYVDPSNPFFIDNPTEEQWGNYKKPVDKNEISVHTDNSNSGKVETVFANESGERLALQGEDSNALPPALANPPINEDLTDEEIKLCLE